MVKPKIICVYLLLIILTLLIAGCDRDDEDDEGEKEHVDSSQKQDHQQNVEESIDPDILLLKELFDKSQSLEYTITWFEEKNNRTFTYHFKNKSSYAYDYDGYHIITVNNQTTFCSVYEDNTTCNEREFKYDEFTSIIKHAANQDWHYNVKRVADKEILGEKTTCYQVSTVVGFVMPCYTQAGIPIHHLINVGEVNSSLTLISYSEEISDDVDFFS